MGGEKVCWSQILDSLIERLILTSVVMCALIINFRHNIGLIQFARAHVTKKTEAEIYESSKLFVRDKQG